MKKRLLLSMASVDMIDFRSSEDANTVQSNKVTITTRGSVDVLEVLHSTIENNTEQYDTKEIILYEPATGSKERLYDFIEREMLGKYTIQSRGVQSHINV